MVIFKDFSNVFIFARVLQDNRPSCTNLAKITTFLRESYKILHNAHLVSIRVARRKEVLGIDRLQICKKNLKNRQKIDVMWKAEWRGIKDLENAIREK